MDILKPLMAQIHLIESRDRQIKFLSNIPKIVSQQMLANSHERITLSIPYAFQRFIWNVQVDTCTIKLGAELPI